MAEGAPRSPSPATCVHCGAGVPLLYRRYASTVLKVMSCAACGQVADKYVEYDPVLVLLDLVLLNRQAIRHILFNTPFRSHWKLCVVMVLIEGYVTYCGAGGGPQGGDAAPWQPDDLSSPLGPPHLDGERLFYVICVESLLAAAAFLAAWALGCRVLASWSRRPALTPLLVVKALVLGSFAVFFWLPALVWSQPGREWVDLAFIQGYMFLGLVQTLSVVCAAPRAAAAPVVALAMAAKAATRSLLREADWSAAEVLEAVQGTRI